VECPLYFSSTWSTWEIENGEIKITKKGKELFKKLVQQFKDDPKSIRVLEAIKIIRVLVLYNKLNREELLLFNIHNLS